MNELKIFHKDCDNNLKNLSEYLIDIYKKMKMMYKIDENDYFVESNSISTIKWKEYNIFQFNNVEIYDLLKDIKELSEEVFYYYKINPKKERYIIQGWFNINHKDSGKLDWHRHVDISEDTYRDFHGYYGVNIDDSSTLYQSGDLLVENKNKNNRIVMANSYHQHCMGNWSWDQPRISVAYDLMPLSKAIDKNVDPQHWFPLIY